MIAFDRDIVFLDCETLGLDRDAPIWEFAAVRVRADGGPEFSPVNLQILHDAGGWLASLPDAFAEDYRNRYDIQIALPPMQAAREIRAITEGAIIAGSNPHFDMDRLGILLRDRGIEPGWHYHPLDIPSMIVGQISRTAVRAAFDLDIDLGRVSLQWKSDQLSRRISVNPDDFARHTALGDVQWCLAQWRAMNGQTQ